MFDLGFLRRSASRPSTRRPLGRKPGRTKTQAPVPWHGPSVKNFQEGTGHFNLGPVQELRIRKSIVGTVADGPGPKTLLKIPVQPSWTLALLSRTVVGTCRHDKLFAKLALSSIMSTTLCLGLNKRARLKAIICYNLWVYNLSAAF